MLVKWPLGRGELPTSALLCISLLKKITLPMEEDPSLLGFTSVNNREAHEDSFMVYDGEVKFTCSGFTKMPFLMHSFFYSTCLHFIAPLVLSESQFQIMQEIYYTQSSHISPPFPTLLHNQYHIAEFLFSKVCGY